MWSNSNLVHYLTGTYPLSQRLKELAPKGTGGLNFPTLFHGVKLSFLEEHKKIDTTYNILEYIPTWFWLSKNIKQLPLNAKFRRNMCLEVMDMNHWQFCRNQEFHANLNLNCICQLCTMPMEHYHERFCMGLLPKPKVLLEKLKLEDISKTSLAKPKVMLKRISSPTQMTMQKDQIIGFVESRKSSRNRVQNKKYFNEDWIT